MPTLTPDGLRALAKLLDLAQADETIASFVRDFRGDIVHAITFLADTLEKTRL